MIKIEIKELRKMLGLSQSEMASVIGVSTTTITRWETDKSKPSSLALRKLEEIEAEFKNGVFNQMNHIKIKPEKERILKNFEYNGINYEYFDLPYVLNGPQNQNEFHNLIIHNQEHKNSDIPWSKYKKRLSLIQEIDGENTPQYLLEAPSRTRKSWSSDYGPHGWHRYVGRFPPHLIRSIINGFGATESDVILDPFCGSGTALVESRLLGINAIGVEISPLSALISRVKSSFPLRYTEILQLIESLEKFYKYELDNFLGFRTISEIEYSEIMSRSGNYIKTFTNIERWFTKEALLGCSIIVQFIDQLDGYEKEIVQVALSSKMRSIGNVDVDVVRAEYRKTPRENVDVLKLVSNQLRKFNKDILNTRRTHEDLIKSESSITVIEGDIKSAKIKENSISYIITSPPYGVESISYLRTHLLSFRVLEKFLGIDPYNFGDGIIGSEYLDEKNVKSNSYNLFKSSPTCKDFFADLQNKVLQKNDEKRVFMMIKFFEDMYDVIANFKVWLKKEGKVAFIIGNKSLGDIIIPTNTIIKEIFEYHDFEFVEEISQKLKTNNSNSVVPWQSRIIENEFIMIFRKS